MFSITAISEMWVKTTLIYQYTPIRMIKLENCGNTKCWQGCRETRSLKHNSGSVKRYLYSEEKKKTCWLRWKRICLQCRRPRFSPWVGKIPWRREWQFTSVSLPEEFHGQRNPASYSLWSRKESDTTKRLNTDTHTLWKKV